MAGSVSNIFGDVGGAVSGIFAGKASQSRAGMFRTEAQGDVLKGEGALLEGVAYGRAHDLALTNKAFTEESTAIQEAQQARAVTRALGQERAAAGASGVGQGGSVEDILSESAQQGALQRAVLAKQGLITEAGYQEQADTFTNMQQASNIAVQGAYVAYQGHEQAAAAEDTAATVNFIGGGIKALAAVANVFTGGAAGAVTDALTNAIIPGNWGEQS